MTTPPVELQARCEYWLNRLGMAEWLGCRPKQLGIPRVRVLIRSKKKMDGAVGSCAWHAEECTADIELLRGHGEETLLHELLHLALEGHMTYAETKYSEMHERALNRLVDGYLAVSLLPAIEPDSTQPLEICGSMVPASPPRPPGHA
jgi:hypothetical protein